MRELPTHPVSGRPIRLAVVDDSASMRALIRLRAEESGMIQVVGEAGDPYEAREMIKRTAPDVLTLDIEMPRMNGLSFLEKLMRLRPMPVVMVSSLTVEGGAATIAALELGAVDYALKPDVADKTAFADLPHKIVVAARARVGLTPPGQSGCAPAARSFRPGRVIAIGASTGGVDAIQDVLRQFPDNCPPTVIVQHMPRSFTASFAARLNTLCPPAVKEADEGDLLAPGNVYLAPGSDSHLVVSRTGSARCHLRPDDLAGGHRPSVDVLFNSLADRARNVTAALLTGMGTDGAEGLRTLKERGAATVVQDEATSTVFGMPRAAMNLGAADHAAPIGEIAAILLADRAVERSA